MKTTEAYRILSMASLANIYSIGTAVSYPSLLRLFYTINASLKRDGISAPSDDSLRNTRELYELIGRPLDTIPTIHVGGTNGKVRG